MPDTSDGTVDSEVQNQLNLWAGVYAFESASLATFAVGAAVLIPEGIAITLTLGIASGLYGMLSGVYWGLSTLSTSWLSVVPTSVTPLTAPGTASSRLVLSSRDADGFLGQIDGVPVRVVASRYSRLLAEGIAADLYIIAGQDLKRVNPLTADIESKGPDLDWPDARLMTSLQESLYVIDGGEGGRLWRVDKDTLVNNGVGPVNDWPNPRTMSSVNGSLYVIDGGEGGRLWRVDPGSLVNSGVGPANDWPDPKLMTSLNGKLYVVDGGQGGRLWRVNPDTLVNEGVGPENDWPNPIAMAALDGRVYILDSGEGGRLWRVNPDTLVSDGVGPSNDWPSPLAMVVCGGELLVLERSYNGSIWRIDRDSLAATLIERG